MSEAVRLEKQGRIGVITVDSPPVNALGQAVRQGLKDSLEAVLRDPELAAAVVVCAGRTFIAGADIREFGKPPTPPSLVKLIRQPSRTARSRWSPRCTALRSAAGSRSRSAATTASRSRARAAACPRSSSASCPGAGGTQRLPRLIGAKPALEMIVTGEPVAAKRALELGLLDAIIEGDLLAGALALRAKA